MSSRLGPLDLLQERRRASDAPEQGGPLVPARGLLLQGTALGGGVLALMLLLLVALAWRQQQVSAALAELSGVKAQVQALETRVGRVRRAKAQLERSSEGVAKGLVGVSSGSALVTQLSAVTPAGVQLTELRAPRTGLVLKGVAADPQAFRRVNGLKLLLTQSPLFDSESVRVVKVQRDGASEGSVEWELSARFAALTPAQQLAVLQALQADGLVKRLQLLQSKGVLP